MLGRNHVREKDGRAVLFWLQILAERRSSVVEIMVTPVPLDVTITCCTTTKPSHSDAVGGLFDRLEGMLPAWRVSPLRVAASASRQLQGEHPVDGSVTSRAGLRILWTTAAGGGSSPAGTGVNCA